MWNGFEQQEGADFPTQQSSHIQRGMTTTVCGIDCLRFWGAIMSGMHLSLKAINNELERLGSNAVVVKGDGYFYFSGGEATDWLDCTVRVSTLHSLTLEQWIEQYRMLKEKNRALPESRHGGGQTGGRTS